jgi:hypothetical protein
MLLSVLAFGARANSFGLRDAHLLNECAHAAGETASDSFNGALAIGSDGVSDHPHPHNDALVRELTAAKHTVMMDSDMVSFMYLAHIDLYLLNQRLLQYCFRVSFIQASFPLLIQFVAGSVTAISLTLRLTTSR